MAAASSDRPPAGALRARHPAARAGRSSCPSGRLVDLIWSGEPPRGARAVLQTYISRLRALLGDGARIELHNGAYRIQVDPRTVDAHRFATWSPEARETDDPQHRAGICSAGALALWQGPALDGIGPGRERLGARLEEARKTALDLRIVADLDAGRHAELVGELTELSAGAPLDERLTGHLMTALFRDGRRAEALDVYGQGPRPDPRRPRPGPRRVSCGNCTPRSCATTRRCGPQPAARPSQLPAAVPDFVGRAALLDQLDDARQRRPDHRGRLRDRRRRRGRQDRARRPLGAPGR